MLSLIILDIDHFKNVNDEYGHQAGDVILKELSRLLKKCVREIDLVARYGGEEFVIILPETPKRNAIIVAERMRAAIMETDFPHEPQPLNITASIGVAGYPEDDIRTRIDIISKADLALYKAKRDGRNQVCLYSPQLEVEFS
jgi:diguanylate cyclase (GGDEF)-like protein